MPSVLALETSCDESAAALLCLHGDGRLEVESSRIASQVEEHARWGGVVPEIASRRHVEALPGLIGTVLEQSGRTWEDVDLVAATVAPGLAGALMVASVTGRTLAALHGRPFLAVHHLEGHLASVHLGAQRPAPGGGGWERLGASSASPRQEENAFLPSSWPGPQPGGRSLLRQQPDEDGHCYANALLRASKQ